MREPLDAIAREGVRYVQQTGGVRGRHAHRSAALGRLYPVRWTEVCSTPRRGVRRILAEFCTTPVPAPEPARLIIELGGPDSYTEDYRRLTGDFYLKF